jgi:type VI secretion system protein ImpI
MARGARIAIYDGEKRTWETRDFHQQHIRIGRNKLNDIQLESAGVSQFHATLDLIGDALVVRDVGSRNGTHARAIGQLPPNTPSHIGFSTGEIVIVHFLLRVQVTDLPDPVEAPPPPPTSPTERPQRTVRSEAVLRQRLEPLYAQYREAWNQLFDGIEGSVQGLEEEPRQAVCDFLAQEMPLVAHEPDFAALHNPIPVDEASIVSTHSPVAKPLVALQALTQLARGYFPEEHTLESPEDVAVFVSNIKETIDVFVKCFIPMREGFRALTSQLELPQARPAGAVESTRSGVPRVEDALTAEELASALLDWRKQRRPESNQAIEWVFADLMIHQMAMMTGVMQGVKSLLAELSPAAIEKALEDPRRGAGGLQIGPFRYKQLWEMYATRHADLAEEDKEAFEVIFGPEFARAYTGMTSDTIAVRAVGEHTFATGRTPSFRPPPRR